MSHKSKWIVTGKVLLYCLLCAIILAATSALTTGFPPALTVGIACAATLILTVCLTGFDRERLSQIGVWPGAKTLGRISAGLLMGFVLAGLQVLTVIIDGHTTLSVSSATVIFKVEIIFLLYFFVALREEIAFRGYPLRTLDHRIGPAAAQAIIAIVFIVEHFIGGMNWWQAILGPGIGAIWFGIAALRTKGIALSFGLHLAWNFGQWTFGFKDQSGIFKPVIDAGYESHVELVGWMGYLLAMTVGIVSLYFWKKSKRPNTTP